MRPEVSLYFRLIFVRGRVVPYKQTVQTNSTIQYRTVPGEYPHQNIQGIEDLGALLPAPRSSIPC